MKANEKADVLVIGAGASGLAAARALSRAGKKVEVLEARDYIGGRIHTVQDSVFTKPAELGAEFIHGDLPVTLELLKEYKISYSPASGEMLYAREGKFETPADLIDEHQHLLEKKLKSLKKDVPVKEFLKRNFPGRKFLSMRKRVTRFVEGYESGEARRFSTYDFRDDWLGMRDSEQYRPDGGYQKLMDAIAADCRKKGCIFRLATTVKQIRWKKKEVNVTCENGEVFAAEKVVITVPLGIWQAESISFLPALPEKTNAAKQLGFGDVIKILLLFRERFWEEKTKIEDLLFIFSDAPISTWWTQYPSTFPLLTGWVSGPRAKQRMFNSDEEILREAVQSLSVIFKESEQSLREKLAMPDGRQAAWKVINWSKDIFTRGSYNYATVNAKKYIKILGRPVEHTLFFAGEVFSTGSTVESALASGFETAEKILHARVKKNLTGF